MLPVRYNTSRVIKMPDYKEMYLELFRETERAINILIEAQRKCEEAYINAREPEILSIERENGSSDV